jgi:hypothetical protein
MYHGTPLIISSNHSASRETLGFGYIARTLGRRSAAARDRAAADWLLHWVGAAWSGVG